MTDIQAQDGPGTNQRPAEETPAPPPTQHPYAKGGRYRIIKDGARLWGWKPITGGWQGWGRAVPVGEVLTCKGWRPGMGSDPGPDIVQWEDPVGTFVEFHPSAGKGWFTRPDDSYLELVTDQ